MAEGTLVTFNKDVYPYCRGDVVRLNAVQLAAVDESAKRNNIEQPYVRGAKDFEEVAGPGDGRPEVLRAEANPLLPEYPQVDENGEPVLEQLTRSQADAKVKDSLTSDPAEAKARVEEAKENPEVFTEKQESDLAPGVEEPKDTDKKTKK